MTASTGDAADGAAALQDPRPDGVRAAHDRVTGRWRQLPLATAQRRSDVVRRLAQQWVDLSATSSETTSALPDLGPAVAIDQLTVAVYDACHTGSVPSAVVVDQLKELLAQLH